MERGSGGGEGDPAGCTVQEFAAEIGFELPDGAAQRRLRHVQAGGGPAEVQFVGDRHEIAQRA